MVKAVDVANFCIASSGLTVSVIGLLFARHARFLEDWHKKYFNVTFAIVIVYVLSDLISQLSFGFMGESFGAVSATAVFFESFFSSVLMPLLSVMILHACKKDLKSPFLFINICLWTVYVIILVFTQFTNSIYYITYNNVYHRGPLYPLLLIPPVLLMLSNLIGLFVWKKDISEKQFFSMLLYIIIPMISMIIQMFFYGLLLIVLGSSISAMILFIYIMNEQIEERIAQAKEAAIKTPKV